MTYRPERAPGDIAPTTGKYELLDVLGSRTGTIEHVKEGEPLPAAPRSFTWRHVVESDEEQLRALYIHPIFQGRRVTEAD